MACIDLIRRGTNFYALRGLGNMNIFLMNDISGYFSRKIPCNCGSQCREIYKARFDSFPLGNPFTNKIGSLLSKIVFKRFEHDFIRFWYICFDCDERGCITIEYSRKGIVLRYGYYTTSALTVQKKRTSKI